MPKSANKLCKSTSFIGLWQTTIPTTHATKAFVVVRKTNHDITAFIVAQMYVILMMVVAATINRMSCLKP